MIEVYWTDDAQLMGYGESDSSGAWIKLQVTPETLESFRGLKGTVFNVTMVRYEDDGTVKEKKTTHMAEWLGARESDDMFRAWLSEIYPLVNIDNNEDVAELTRHILNVESRAEVDRDKVAGDLCRRMMKAYTAWLQRCEGQAQQA